MSRQLCQCGRIAIKGERRCEKCRTTAPGRMRRWDDRSAAKRGYDRAWRKLRSAYLDDNPLCELCRAEGRTTAAAHVHHIETIADAPHRRLDYENLEALCIACHSRRHHDAGLDPVRGVPS